MKETNTFVKAIRFTLLTVMLLLVSQRVKCQPSNNNALSPRQIDFSTMILSVVAISAILRTALSMYFKSDALPAPSP